MHIRARQENVQFIELLYSESYRLTPSKKVNLKVNNRWAYRNTANLPAALTSWQTATADAIYEE